MQNSYIDGITFQPKRFGELYTERNLRLSGEVRYDLPNNQIQTRGLRFLCSPIDGGSEAITVIPDGFYPIPTPDSSLWLQFRRTSGTSTASLGATLLAVAAGSQFTPKENWVQLFHRSATVGEVIAFNSFLISLSPTWTRVGISRGNSIYDAIVSPTLGDPLATHSNIQAAINDCSDGNRILVLDGLYVISVATGYSSSSALSWVGKTLTIEGEGNNTIIRNGSSFSRAFSVQSNSASFSGSSGSGSKIKNLQIQNFNQSVEFDGGGGLGIRSCDIDIFMSDFSSYISPSVIGTGTSDQNSIREKIISISGVSQERYSIASSTPSSNIARIEAEGTLTFEEKLVFNRPTLGYGVLPLGSVIPIFSNLSATYVCTSTTSADPYGFVLCNGLTINDTSSPFHGLTVPQINNDVFLMGNVTAGVVGGANSLNTAVPALGLTVSGTNNGSTVSWSTSSVSASGSGSFLKSQLNSNQISHTHNFAHSHSLSAHSHDSGNLTAKVDFGAQLVYIQRRTTTAWSPTHYHEGGDFRGSHGATTTPSFSTGTDVQGFTGGGSGSTGAVNLNTSFSLASWDNVYATVAISGVSVPKTAWNQDQPAHSHVWSGSVGGTATANTWDNRPKYITAKYLMRIK